jgi:hypothetical protein
MKNLSRKASLGGDKSASVGGFIMLSIRNGSLRAYDLSSNNRVLIASAFNEPSFKPKITPISLMKISYCCSDEGQRTGGGENFHFFRPCIVCILRIIDATPSHTSCTSAGSFGVCRVGWFFRVIIRHRNDARCARSCGRERVAAESIHECCVK